MVLEASVEYNHYIAPVERRDLQDWFPQTLEYFPGYIRTEVFRTALASAMHHAGTAAALHLDAIDSGSYLNPLLVDEKKQTEERQREYGKALKKALLDEAQVATWFRWQPERDLAAEMRQQSKDYYKAATRGVAEKALDKVGGKVAKQVKKVGGHQIGKMIGQGKINEKVGKTIGQHGLGSHKIDYKLKPKGFSHNLVEVDIDINLPDMVVGDTMDTIADTIPAGIEVSMNNEDTRGWLSRHTGMSDKWAGRVMGGVDTVMDFVPIAAATKMVEGAAVNAYMGWVYGKEADKLERSQQERHKLQADFDRRLKSAITNDIESLTPEEVIALKKKISG